MTTSYWTADLHCDTVLALLEAQDQKHPKDPLINDLHIDLQKLQKGGYGLQTFALFTDRKDPLPPEHKVLRLYNAYLDLLEKGQEVLVPIKTRQDLANARRDKKIGALLSLEEGDVMFKDPDLLKLWHRLGVRIIALTWNYPNAIANPNIFRKPSGSYKTPFANQELETEKGLTPFGRTYVETMENLGILVDVSHLGDKGFWDVISIAKKPVIASHSNCRSLCKAVRNLSDDMILAIAKTGGVIGINFCGNFLKDDGKNESRIQDLVAHIKHIRDLVGTEHIALGTDFDGISSHLEIPDASAIGDLWKALEKEGFTHQEIAGIAGENVYRLLMETLPE